MRAAGWDTALSSSSQPLLEWVEAKVTTESGSGGEADGKEEILVLVTMIRCFALLQMTNECWKRDLSPSLYCFGGLEWTPGIASGWLSAPTPGL